MIFIRGVLSAILAITTVQASPHNSFGVRSSNLHTRALEANKCVDFGTGAPNGYHSFGDLCVVIDATNIKVTFPPLPGGNAYTSIHLYFDCDEAPTERNPGGFDHSSYCTWSGTTASCTIPLSALDCGPIGCDSDELYFAAHADVSGPYGGTGWGNINQGIIIGDCNPRANCAKYFTVTPECKCPVVTTFGEVICTSTITTTTKITTKPPDITGVPTSCDDPGTTSTVIVDGGTSACPPCTIPYFCGCT